MGSNPTSFQVMWIRQETSSHCISDSKLRFFTYVELMTKHRKLNPTLINEGLLSQLQPDPLILNQNFIDQLNQVVPDSIVVPTIDSSDRSSIDPSLDDLDFWKQSQIDPQPVDDIWNADRFDILS